MVKLHQDIKTLAEMDTVLFAVGIILALIIITLGYREYRGYKSKQRETTTRLMMGPFDMYSQADRERVDALMYDLYGLYRTSWQKCGITVPVDDNNYNAFVRDFAHPYINGRYDVSFLPDDVAAVFRELHDQYVKEKNQSA